MQKNICIGRLTNDVELRYTANNKAVCDLNVAVNNGKDDTTYMRIIVFGKVAENCNSYLGKGSLVGIEFIIKNHNWEDKNGKKHYDMQFIAQQVSFLETKNKQVKVEEKPKEEVNTKDLFAEFAEETIINDELELPF